MYGWMYSISDILQGLLISRRRLERLTDVLTWLTTGCPMSSKVWRRC